MQQSQQIIVFDRERNAIYPRHPTGVFECDNVDSHDPVGAEERWGDVETRLPPAFALVDQHRALVDPDTVKTLRDLLAVHWARSPATRIAHDRITADVIAASRTSYAARPDLLGIAYRQRTGLVAATAGELDWANERLHTVARSTTEQWWSQQSARAFQVAQDRFREHDIQIGYTHGLDLVIGIGP